MFPGTHTFTCYCNTLFLNRFSEETRFLAAVFVNSDSSVAPGLLERIKEHAAFPALARKMIALLSKKGDDLSLGDKSRLLSAVSLCSDQPGYRDSIQTFVRTHLLTPPPLNDLDQSEYSNGLTALVDAAMDSGDVTLVEGLVQVVCASEDDHAARYVDDVGEAFAALAQSATHNASLLDILGHCMAWCTPRSAPKGARSWSWLKPELAQAVVRRAVLPMLRAAPRDSVVAFCNSSFKGMLAVIDEPYAEPHLSATL